ncbi:hypothetical protein [Ensifer aridi]|uniref:hypothetical protein n=1 Tax=Ensifer aridi TaxID=1708715 RepID=UPI00111BEBD2|nr:hypothetical protein [Ensifer aridi]
MQTALLSKEVVEPHAAEDDVRDASQMAGTFFVEEALASLPVLELPNKNFVTVLYLPPRLLQGVERLETGSWT